MNFHKFLEKNEIITSSKDFKYTIDDDEFTLSYEEYQKKYEDKVIGIYYLFNVSEFHKNLLRIIKNYEEFLKFQEYFISKKFFQLKDYLRYNLYMVFILPDDDKNIINDETRTEIEWNLDYSRKLFLKYSEIRKYFNCFKIISEFKPTNNYDILKYKAIKHCISRLDAYKMKSVLTTKMSDENREEMRLYALRASMENDLTYDHIKRNDISTEKFFEKYFKNDSRINNKKYELKHIDKIINKSFRKQILKDEETILKKFNLLCGENASGKTSLLELIEYTLTGKINKSHQNEEEAYSELYSSNGNVFFSNLNDKTSKAIKNTWYKNKIGNLNKLFCRINFFDIDAAYNFAIKHGTNSYQEFFCDYQLLFMKENILEHIKVFNFTKKSLESFMEYVNVSDYDKFNYDKGVIYKIKNFLNRHRKGVYREVVLNDSTLVKKYISRKSYIENCITVLTECVNKIDSVLEKEVEVYIDYINIIYWLLFSKNQFIHYDKNSQELTVNKSAINYEKTNLEDISTAQRVCVALSVIFTQFFSAPNAPKFILLDETVANFDSIHLLNLLDFLRELAINDVQIVFTTADTKIKELTKNKFSFLGESFKIITVNNQQENK